MRKVIVLAALLGVVVFAQEKGSFVDARDKKTYKTVKIGTQTWMAENLNYHGEDGFLGLCYGDDPKKKIKKPENCKKYGRMYDWEEAMKACPAGWHLPSDKEWKILVDFAGGDDVAGKKFKSKNGWNVYDFSGKSPKSPKCKWKEDDEIDDRGRTITGKERDECTTDEYEFSALPGGSGGGIFGDFYYIGQLSAWWTSSAEYETAYYRAMGYNNGRADSYESSKRDMFNIRCVQD